MNKPLSSADIESFMDRGYCKLPGAFTTAQAAAARACVWKRIEEKSKIREADPSTWPGSYDIEEHLTTPEVIDCFTDRLVSAVEQIVGPGRWCGRRKWGLWPVNFKFGSEHRPYEYPNSGWHIDGNFFLHTLDCPKEGVLLFGLFTDIQPQWGGTILAGGSHKQTARVLARHPQGIAHGDLFKAVLSQPIGNFEEVNGEAGDVFLAHPFLFHTRGLKHAGPPRVVSNTEAALKEPMKFDRPNPADLSILEQSIMRALKEEPVPPVGGKLVQF